jgi:hypothetical protein
LYQEIRDYYGSGLKDMKVFYTNTYTIMVGKLTRDVLANKDGDPQKKTLFAVSCSEKLYSAKCKCQLYLDPNMWTKTHTMTIDFTNSTC